MRGNGDFAQARTLRRSRVEHSNVRHNANFLAEVCHCGRNLRREALKCVIPEVAKWVTVARGGGCQSMQPPWKWPLGSRVVVLSLSPYGIFARSWRRCLHARQWAKENMLV